MKDYIERIRGARAELRELKARRAAEPRWGNRRGAPPVDEALYHRLDLRVKQASTRLRSAWLGRALPADDTSPRCGCGICRSREVFHRRVLGTDLATESSADQAAAGDTPYPEPLDLTSYGAAVGVDTANYDTTIDGDMVWWTPRTGWVPMQTPDPTAARPDPDVEAGTDQRVSGSHDDAQDEAEDGAEPIALPWLHMREPGARPRTPQRARQDVDGAGRGRDGERAHRSVAVPDTAPAAEASEFDRVLASIDDTLAEAETATPTTGAGWAGAGREVAPSPVTGVAAREVLARADELNEHLDNCQAAAAQCGTCAGETDGSRDEFWRDQVPAAEAVIAQEESAALLDQPDRPDLPRCGQAVAAARDAVDGLRHQPVTGDRLDAQHGTGHALDTHAASDVSEAALEGGPR